MSLKFRIIAWFSLMILLLSSLVVTIVFLVSDEAMASNPSEELVKVVSTNASKLTSDKKKKERIIPYKNGIYCQLLDKNMNHIDGAIPEGISLSTPLQNGTISTVTTETDEYYVYDMEILGQFWIRGAVSTSQLSETTVFILISSAIITPFIILVSIFGGWLITSRSLKPVDKIISSMETINSGDDLSKRLSINKGPLEIRRLANEFDKMAARLDKSFEAEKQFASDVSHELRTPLTVILGECTRIKPLLTSEDACKSIDVIEKQGSKMSELVKSLLSITRLEQKTESFPLSSLNLSDFVEIYCEMFAQEHNISLEESEEGKLLLLRIEKDIIFSFNPNLMSRIICNLLDNAKKFTDANGKINVSLASNDKEIILSITDNGVGISEDDLPLIWRRFWQADPSRQTYQGVGLGLSMVKEMVEFQGGKITASSRLDNGTTFTIVFPKQ